MEAPLLFQLELIYWVMPIFQGHAMAKQSSFLMEP